MLHLSEFHRGSEVYQFIKPFQMFDAKVIAVKPI